MQQLGALALQNGVWILPHGNALERALHLLLVDLKNQGGGGLLFTAQTAQTELENEIIGRFRLEREQDYAEFLERCTQFLSELQKETGKEKFTFAELEENEEDLHKLTKWLRKIYHRDFFGGPQRDSATTALAHCRSALETYAEQVYQRQEYAPPERLSEDEELQ
jgi:hypothetical protein